LLTLVDRFGEKEGSMTKADLVERVAKRKDVPELSKKAFAQIVDAVFMELGDYFIRSRTGRKSARLTYPRFGTFSKRRKNARIGRNPRTGEPIQIPEQVTVVFSPSLDLWDLLNADVKVGQRRA
jgi:nucleoid DNA-binding protein